MQYCKTIERNKKKKNKRKLLERSESFVYGHATILQQLWMAR